MALIANTTNQTNAIMLQQVYSTLPQEFVVYNALSGDNRSNYAHYERATMGWMALSALSAFAIKVDAAGNGVQRDLWLQTSPTNSIYLSSNNVYAGNIYSNGILITPGGGSSNIDTGVRALTGNWQSTYSTVSSFSAGWGTGGNSGIPAAVSGNWQSTYTTVCANSASWAPQSLTLADTTSAYNLSISNGNTVSLSALGYQNLSASSSYLTIQSFVNTYIAPNNIQIPKGYTVSLYNNRMYIFAGTNPSDPNQYLQVNLNPHLPIYVAVPLSGSGGTLVDSFPINSFKTAKYNLQIDTAYNQDTYYSEINVATSSAGVYVYYSEYGQIGQITDGNGIGMGNSLNVGFIANADNPNSPTAICLSAVYTPIPNSNKIMYIKGLRTNHYLI